MEPSYEIRKLSPKQVSELTQILDYGNAWKDLMGIIPKTLQKDDYNTDTTVPKYNAEHVMIIENASLKHKNKSCTEILLDEWGTSGRVRPTLGHLLDLLQKAKLYRAADYVAVDLLKQPPPERPNNGPQARITLDKDYELQELLDDLSYSSSAIENILQTSVKTNINYSYKKILPKIVVNGIDDEIITQNLHKQLIVKNKISNENNQSDLIKFDSSSSSPLSINENHRNIPQLSLLQNASITNTNNEQNIPNLSILQNSESILQQFDKPNIPNLSILQSKSNSSDQINLPNLSILQSKSDDHDQINLPNLSIFQSKSISSDQINLPNLSILQSKSNGHDQINLPNLSIFQSKSISSDQINLPNLSILQSKSNGHDQINLPNLSILQSKSNDPDQINLPNLSILQSKPNGNVQINLPNLSILQSKSNDPDQINLPNLSILQSKPNGNDQINLPNLSILQSKPNGNDQINLPNLSILQSKSNDPDQINLPNLSLLQNSSSKSLLDQQNENLPNLSIFQNSKSTNAFQEEQSYSNSALNNCCSNSERPCASPLPNIVLNTILPHYSYCNIENTTNNFNDIPYKEGGRLLGRGNFSNVYLAINLIDKPVAIKKFKKKVNIDDVTKHFKTEVEVLSNYKHENLLTILGYSWDGCTYCLIYEFMEGGTLKDQLKRKEDKLIWTTRLYIALGTARAIKYLHTIPLIHRDIKSANILLDINNKPKLSDFGLAILLKSNQYSSNETDTFGTTAYMPPEAFGGDISVKFDTFSFGVVLLELLTSLPPINEDKIDLVFHVEEECDNTISPLLDTTIGTWYNNNINFADEIYKISQKCLIKDEKTRSSMIEIEADLENLIKRCS